MTLASGLAYNSAGTEDRTLVKIDLFGSGGRSGSKNNHYGLIVYKGGPTSVSLSVSPNPVPEGDSTIAEVTVTATLSSPWDGDADVVIPLKGTHVTSEAGDWAFEPNVIIRRGQSTGTTRLFVLPDADSDNETMTVGLGTPLPTGARQYATDTQLTAGTPSSVTLTITDAGTGGSSGQGTSGSSAGDGASGDGVSGASGSAGELGAVAAPGHAALIAQMRTWRNDPQWDWLKEHTDRWDRALLAFGETVSDGTLTAMTAAEGQAFADRGWERWVEVAEALRQLEGGGVQAAQEDPPPQPAQDPPAALHATLLGQMNDWREDPQWRMYHSHTSRWDRALLAFGEPVADTSLTPMTDAQAQEWADSGLSRWVPVAAALKSVVTGTSGANTLTGTSAGELLVGLGGADDLSAQGGNDELRGGNGNDDLTGGAGRDRFVFFSGETGANAITDFASGDVIVLKGSGWRSVRDIADTGQAVGQTGYRYTLASGLTVETTNSRSLRTEDFVTE